MPEYTPEARAAVHRLFQAHGFQGDLLVVDDARDECIFVIPRAALNALPEEAIATALQSMLRRKVWLVDDAPVWVRQAHPFE